MSISVLEGTKTVASTATPEPLVSARTMVCSVVIQALGGNNSNTGKNTGKVKVGSVESGFLKGVTLGIPTAGETAPSITIESSKGVNEVDLSKFYIGVGVNGEGVSYLAIQV